MSVVTRADSVYWSFARMFNVNF